ncbi:unnamed protein product [Medioppia subpectinata]|uniref:C2H2-type domain-containing protein n=1 Tax=Medioppia subpectinata TaxID=1979941 RepID=A0A7R9LB58_9ACAR|nr:unnamed protein product [Medioppia subpectinata]CAG2116882.1 unnamed protein product [Medioppia subpectinata]
MVKVESKTVFGGNGCQSSSMSGANGMEVMDVVDVVAASVEANDYIGSRVVSGKERLFCKWTDCRYESNQKSCISRHILNKHLNPNKANPFDSYDETKYWEKILNSTKSLLKRSHPKTTPEVKPVAPPEAEAVVEESLPEPPVLTPFDSEMTSDGIDETFFDDSQWLDQMSMDSLQAMIPQKGVSVWDNNDGVNVGLDESDVQKNHLNISNNEENVLLSCKGLASMSKVRQYYESQVLDGEKYFLCKWKRCEFKTKKSQKIAQHINLSHIGVEFKCNKPNCNKVFKNPNTYREHQKNHICGFGIFGYGSKGVIGVCRNENLNRYRERVIIDSKKFYRCKWDNCNAITRYHMAMKRHLHGHVCPYRVNLKLKQNQQVISDMKSDNWNLDLGLGF